MNPFFMNLWHMGIAVVLSMVLSGCDDHTEMLQGQTNLKLTYLGLVVDESGRPLPGVEFQYRLEAYPRDWTFATRGRDNESGVHRGKTDMDGRFQIELDGCFLRLQEVSGPMGYRHLYERDTGDYGPHDAPPYTMSVRLISWGQQLYKSDPDRPAVFVFVRDGVKEVSALPSRGGYEAEGPNWIPNEPRWPRKPSLKDVVYVPPATRPSTQPGAD